MSTNSRPSPFPSFLAVAASVSVAWPLASLAAPIELYDQAKFQGTALGLDRANAHLADYGFDNKTVSVIVRSGQWELCTDANFRGGCLVLGPGQHAALAPAMQRSLSSIRPKEAPSPAAVVEEARPAVMLYDDGDFSGRSLAVNGPVPSLGQLGLGDRVSSIDIRRGQWQLCEDSNYKGQCVTLGAGRHHLSDSMHDEASSIRPVYGSDKRPLPDQGGVTLYENTDFSGRNLLVIDATESLGRMDFNDTASAIEVHDGVWDICTDSSFKGRCITLGPGRHVLSGNAHDRASSLRPRQPDDSPAWRGADPERRRQN